MQPTPRHGDNERTASGLLPNLCDNRVLLLLILIAELLAIVLTLSQRSGGNRLAYLATTSFFIQSIALVDAALLCHARRWLLKLRPLHMGVTVYVGLQLVTVGISLLQGVILDPLPGARVETLLNNLGISAIISAVVMRYLYIRHQNELR